ncbi:MAG: PAS domain S-box protein [Geminicoccaceae bacterium]|nr:PAS domain S-box protein [Geminicoccaceae bacterium]
MTNERGASAATGGPGLDGDAVPALERDLCRALARGQLELRYQPIVDAERYQVTAVEALLRWRHPEHGYVPPDRFVRMAERLGLIGAMTTWLVDRAQAELRAIFRAHPDLRLNVNLSALQAQPAVAHGLCGQFGAAGGVGAGRVTIEVTEGALLEHADPAQEALSILRAAGCRIALDDFGTGFSSLGYLDQFPIDCIKIDKSFVRRMGTSLEAGKLVEAMLFVAQALGLDVVAEGVETADHLAMLAAKGCRRMQGYLFAKPLAAAELALWLKTFRFPEDALEAALWPKARGLPRLLTDNHETALRLFVKHVPAAVAMFDREMRYLAASDRWLKDYGIGDGDVVGRCHYDVLPDTPEKWRRGHRRVLATGKVERSDEDSHVTPGGRTVWLRWEVHPFHTAFGDTAGLIIFSEPITEQVEAERERRRSEARLADYLATASDGLWETDRDHRFTFVSDLDGGATPAWASLKGRTRWEVAGVAAPEADPFWAAHAADHAARRPFRDFVYSHPLGGRVVHRQVSGRPVFAEDGAFTGYRGVVRDVTDRKQAEEALERQTAQLGLAAEIAGIGHWEVDLETGRVTWSETFYRIVGRTPEGFTPTADTRFSVFHPDDRARVAAIVGDAARKGAPFRFEARVQRPDGGVRHVVSRGQPIFDRSDRLRGFFGVAQDVTEGVLRERRLAESEARLAGYLAAASDWLWETDRDHRFVFVSAHDGEATPVWSALQGRTRWEVAGVAAPEADPFWAAHLADLAARRPFRDLVYSHPLGDGVVHRRISGRPVFAGDGAFTGYRGVARDITAQVEAERGLAAKSRENDLYRRLIEAVPDDAYLKDTEHRFLLANPATVRDMGCRTAAELIGKTDFDFFPPDEAARFQEEERAVLAGGVPRQDVHVARRPNGDRRVHLTTKVPLHDEAGALIGFVGVNKDVTDLHEAREAAEAKSRENALYRQVIEALPDLIYVKDADGRFLIANAATARFMGRESPADLVGRSDFDVYDAKDAARWREAELRAMAADGPVRLLQPSFDAEGQEGWMASLKLAIRDAEGRTTGLIGVDRDVTEQRRAERALGASEGRYRDLVDGSLQGICILAGRRLVFANPAFLAFMGFSGPDEARTGVRNAYARQPRATRRHLAAWMGRALLGKPVDDRARLGVRDADGRGRRADVQVRGVVCEGALALQVTMIDVTQQVAYEVELKREKHLLVRQAREKADLAAALARSKAEAEAASDRLKEAVTSLLDGFALFDAKERLVTCSPAFARPYDLPPERLLGTTLRGLMERMYARLPAGERATFEAAHAQPGWLNADGTPVEAVCDGRWYELRRNRTASGMIVVLRSDVTERRRTEADLRRLATVDALTGVFNRRHFVEQGRRLLDRAAADGRPTTLLMLDVDHFKRVNDAHGHAVGDRVLVLVCERLLAVVRASDLVARLGGEEFAVLLPQTTFLEGQAIAERLRAAVAAIAFETTGGVVSPTVSIGVAQGGGEGLDGLLRRADHALYAAKASGRNRVSLAREVAAQGQAR